MSLPRKNIILIGMPGSGKSTVGVILAKRLSLGFIDTDLLIQQDQNRTLQEIVDRDGYMALRTIEEKILLKLSSVNHVIATGGSAAYSAPAMDHLRAIGAVVFLNVDIPTLEARVRDFATRGLAKRPDQTLEELFEERYSLYVKYADITIDAARLSQEETCEAIFRHFLIPVDCQP
jgi:shikimate kinase